jgi:hypothetical protein
VNEDSYRYYAYLLRLWRTKYQGQWQWHASLESPHTGERQSFTDLEKCFTFLRELCSSQLSNEPVQGKELDKKKNGAD